MHWPNGKLPCFCLALGGTAYVSTVTGASETDTDGVAVLSEDVFAIFHTRIDVLVPSSENTARELMKNSVPPASVSNWLPGDCAGHTVKPAPSGPAPSVLKSTTLPTPPVRRLCPMPYIC